MKIEGHPDVDPERLAEWQRVSNYQRELELVVLCLYRRLKRANPEDPELPKYGEFISKHKINNPLRGTEL